MNKHNSSNSILSYLTIALLLAAVAIRGGASFDWLLSSNEPAYTIKDINKAFPEAESYKAQSDKVNLVLNNNEEAIGYALISDDLDAHHQGYAGDVPLMIAINKEHQIISTHLLENNETGEFLDHINDTRLLDSWNGMPLDTLLLQQDIDAVSGATQSSKAIIKTFEKTIANYLEAEQKGSSISAIRIVQLILVLLLLFMSLNMVIARRFKNLYWYYLILVFVVMGLWLKKMLSIELLNNWLTNGLPWQSNWELISILLLSIAMSLLGHKKYYCNYLCPMGAAQMLISKVSPLKKRNLKLKISSLTLRNIYLAFIWTSLILGFALPLSNMEPFIAFSFKVASSIMLLSGIAILILSLFFNRPWCQFCPTGCLLDSLATLKTTSKNNNHEK
jgi:Na+-translocating ferredoxin:NAD+ oxidoreductase RnfG subunit